MSKPADDAGPSERAALRRLEGAVAEALEHMRTLKARATEAESRSEEFEELLKRFTNDEGAAGRLLTRLRALQQENTELRGRLEQGRDGVERLLARIRFLEEQR